jgi:hypothetical protein
MGKNDVDPERVDAFAMAGGEAAALATSNKAPDRGT